VRLASELRTTFTSIEEGLRRRKLWMTIGGALGLALALALITVVSRRRAHPRPPPPPPRATLLSGASAAPPRAQAVDAAVAVITPSAAPQAVPVKSASRGDAATSDERPASSRRLAPIKSVDGTPLIPEPGF